MVASGPSLVVDPVVARIYWRISRHWCRGESDDLVVAEPFPDRSVRFGWNTGPFHYSGICHRSDQPIGYLPQHPDGVRTVDRFFSMFC